MIKGGVWQVEVGDHITGRNGAPVYGTVKAEPRLEPAWDIWSVQTETGTYAFLRIERV